MTEKLTTRRSFTDEFKREAVSRLASSGRPLTQVATELGIQPSMLRSWRGMVKGTASQMAATAGSPAAAVAASAEQAEIRRLRRELERAQMERDILKKAIGIFSVPPK
jgi:transposase